MHPIERLGAFYLGRHSGTGEHLMYEARDLTTHAVCVGMTGSGKTGLCIGLLEEAALDGVPAIIIDPKGDIANLLLTFPELRPADFAPWIDPDEARRKNRTPEEHAAATAAQWREGLARDDQQPERIARLRAAADFRIYTPGSDAGVSVSILASLKAPAGGWGGDEEALREQIAGTVSALLGLAGVDADPLRSPEHILLSTIIEHAWRAGRDLDLAGLITAIQQPPFDKLGVFDVDTFFPPKDRFGLAMALNAVLAAPSFANWLQGEPLDVGRLLFAPDGRPRHCIFSIAHLQDAERMFFTTLLLEQVVAWMRRQEGTGSLRALLYMDEVFGYLPPTANPPSKKPLLTLLKQARAFGLGVVLTTQNPVDLDYKALSNAGTWFLGKLQTERDKARVLDGLESAAGGIDRAEADRLLSGLESRQFLLHNVHGDGPELFSTRWVMSYLRGPLTREQLRRLKPAEEVVLTTATATTIAAAAAAPVSGFATQPPALPPALPQSWLPVVRSRTAAAAACEARTGRETDPGAAQLVYSPKLGAFGRVGFVDRRRDVDEERTVSLLLDPRDVGKVVHWDAGEAVDIDPNRLDVRPEPEAGYAPAPDSLDTVAKLKSVDKDFREHLYRDHQLDLHYCPPLKLFGTPGESEAEFLGRARQAARERRDAEVDKLRSRMQSTLDRLEKRLDRETRELEDDKSDYDSRKREELLSAGETLVGMLGLFGKSRRTTGLSAAARKRRMTTNAKQDIAESEAEIASLESEIAELKQELEDQADAAAERWDAVLEEIETLAVKPRRTDLRVDVLALVWAPSWEFGGERIEAWR